MSNEMLDPHLLDEKVKEQDVVWSDARSAPFSLCGVYYDEGAGAYRRLKRALAESVNRGVRYYASCTAGGRLRFLTDSPYVAISAKIPHVGVESNMPLTTMCGFSLYCDGIFRGKLSATAAEARASAEGEVIFAGTIRTRMPAGTLCACELYFPLYGGLRELWIGLAEGATLLPPRPYTRVKPMVFYGSSITQGAAASRPGNECGAILARRFDSDYINLGFSGSGNGEEPMLDYLCGLDAGAYIFDYNLWQSRPERILPPHYEIYRRLREAHPEVPILLIDKPGITFAPEDHAIRAPIIRATYERAKREGDRLVAYLDSADIFGRAVGEAASADAFADTAHPNDLGFYMMANAMEPILAELFKRAEER
ncbi:MAG: hypothetical protein J6T24_00150 [Clostridia bacterium]|nr:hypothetical protein [Clostridia bacterium]